MGHEATIADAFSYLNCQYVPTARLFHAPRPLILEHYSVSSRGIIFFFRVQWVSEYLETCIASTELIT